MSNIREKYKIQKSTIQESYDRQMILKLNKEYEENVNKAYISIVEYFRQLYPEVQIKMPKAREKSPKSIYGKIKNLQIERISKLFVLGEIQNSEKEELFELLKERVEERAELTNGEIEQIKQLLYEDIEFVNINQFLKDVIETRLSSSTKTALLRILKYKVEESNLKNKYIILQQLENQYGETKVLQTGIPEDNLLKNESIQRLKQDKDKRLELKQPQEFLRAKDLRGMEIVIDKIPENFQTDNAVLQELIQQRNQATNATQKRIYDEKCIIELSREFVDKLSENTNILNKMNAEVLKYSKKHKNKTDGYIADHIKFYIKGNKEQSFELQVKSVYVQELATGEGNAAHTKRPGKNRVLPAITYGINFIKELQYVLPKFSYMIEKNGVITIRKCSLLENTMYFFQKQLNPQTKEYEQVESIILQYEVADNAISQSEIKVL